MPGDTFFNEDPTGASGDVFQNTFDGDVWFGTLSEQTRDTSWDILVEGNRDISWDILNASGRDIAWDILNANARNIAWDILTEGNRDIAWDTLNVNVRNTAWDTLNANDRNVAWDILNDPASDISWNLFARIIYFVSQFYLNPLDFNLTLKSAAIAFNFKIAEPLVFEFKSIETISETINISPNNFSSPVAEIMEPIVFNFSIMKPLQFNFGISTILHGERKTKYILGG